MGMRKANLGSGARALVGLIVGLCVLVTPRPGFSHVSMRSVSNAFVTVHGRRLEYYVSIPPFVARLLGTGKDLKWYADYFSENLTVKAGGGACHVATIYPIAPQPSGHQIVHLAFLCPGPITSLDVRDEGLFLDIDPTHTEFVKLIRSGDPHHVLAEGVLSDSHPHWHVASVDGAGNRFEEWLSDVYEFFRLGVHHILTGYDHILFLLSVIVVAETFLQTLKLVTSFTLAHSITLALAYFNVISLADPIVEPLIALTIIYVAFENLWGRNFDRRWMITFAFGLIHGLGFVDTLKRITVSHHELITALVSFNLGIEGGQLIIVSIALLAFSLMKASPWRLPVLRAMSLGIGGAGLVWFVARVYVLV